MVMRYQTIEQRSNGAFNKLGGCWVLVDGDYSKYVYKNTLNGDLLYIFRNENMKGYGANKYGLVV